MICRASPWRAFLPLLVLLIAQSWSPYSFSWVEKGTSIERSGSFRMAFQTVAETPVQASTPIPTPTAGRTRKPAPTPTLSILPDHNPGLIIGGVIVMAIILTGLLRFIRHPNP